MYKERVYLHEMNAQEVHSFKECVCVCVCVFT